MIVTINYRDVELEIEGVYTEGEKQTYDYIGSLDTFEIEAAYVGGVNIYNMIEGVQEGTLEKICIAKINEQN
jgi:GTP cyclohydrolase III